MSRSRLHLSQDGTQVALVEVDHSPAFGQAAALAGGNLNGDMRADVVAVGMVPAGIHTEAVQAILGPKPGEPPVSAVLMPENYSAGSNLAVE